MQGDTIPLENIVLTSSHGQPADLKTDTPGIWTAPASIHQQRITIFLGEDGIGIDRLEAVNATNVDVVEVNDDLSKLILVCLLDMLDPLFIKEFIDDCSSQEINNALYPICMYVHMYSQSSLQWIRQGVLLHVHVFSDSREKCRSA